MSAQTRQTADQRVRLKAFGMLSYVRPDYDGSPRNLGGTVGADLDGFRFLPHFDLGLDVRYIASSGNVLSERVFSGGPRVSYNRYRFKPYGDFLLGSGRANFKNNFIYPTDTSRVTTYGGGFDVNLTHYWSVRAEAQHEKWRFSYRVPPFYPVEVNVGISYQIHLPSRTGPRD